MSSPNQLQSSFRDPAGYVFTHQGVIYRQINLSGRQDYEAFMSSGLYQALTVKRLIVEHQEIGKPKGLTLTGSYYKLLQPSRVDFISYPYEWSFSQFQDAALLTLQIQQEALRHGMVLKDASAYNIQFVNGCPVLIDTLSFEPSTNARAWTAYKQFCQHFLAPLALMSQVDVRLSSMMRNYIDGIPLDLAAKLLPRHKRLRPGLLIHVWLHAKAQQRFADGSKAPSKPPVASSDTRVLMAQADSLQRLTRSLHLQSKHSTEWGEYYSFTNYEDASFTAKQKLVGTYIKNLKPPEVWDLGGNDGRFTRVALDAGAARAVCFDIDPIAVEKNYHHLKKHQETTLLPLLLDLTNPSPSLGWANAERDSLAGRAKPHTTIMALALIHHLAISNNLSFDLIAAYFAKLGGHLIIEFVPKEDSKVQVLLTTRKDIFSEYTKSGFENAFKRYYSIEKQDDITGSARTLYLMKIKPS
ncbi:MAG TPA: class I SAM-dependent methyltransferase [Candidatus Polarisedimenticolaceae bacterium]|nr:class I SAM-dependent methyltransferase [Candidatus Polarisedimenticolaceae bacterium]